MMNYRRVLTYRHPGTQSTRAIGVTRDEVIVIDESRTTNRIMGGVVANSDELEHLPVLELLAAIFIADGYALIDDSTY